MAAGSNFIEFRIVQTLAPDGQVCGERWQVRCKSILAAVLGLIPLSADWSSWQDINITVVTEQT